MWLTSFFIVLIEMVGYGLESFVVGEATCPSDGRTGRSRCCVATRDIARSRSSHRDAVQPPGSRNGREAELELIDVVDQSSLPRLFPCSSVHIYNTADL